MNEMPPESMPSRNVIIAELQHKLAAAHQAQRDAEEAKEDAERELIQVKRNYNEMDAANRLRTDEAERDVQRLDWLEREKAVVYTNWTNPGMGSGLPTHFDGWSVQEMRGIENPLPFPTLRAAIDAARGKELI